MWRVSSGLVKYALCAVICAAPFAPTASQAEKVDAVASEKETFLALVEFKSARGPIKETPPEEACKDLADRRVMCVDWRDQFLTTGRVIQFFGDDAYFLPNIFRQPQTSQSPVADGRYLTIYQHDEESGEAILLWHAGKEDGKWCLPADIASSVGSLVKPPAQNQKSDGSWCISQSRAQKLRLQGLKKAKKSSPWSFIVGRLGRQKDTGRCDSEEWCWNSSMVAPVTGAETLAGQKLVSRFSLNHWAHANFVGRPKIAAPVRRLDNGEYHTPGRVSLIQNGQVCLDDSFFYPALSGMAPPKYARLSNEGEYCFNVQ
jgi:hypothetical protein